MNKKTISFFIVLFSLLFSILIITSSLLFIPTHSQEENIMDKHIINYLFNPFISSEKLSFMTENEVRHLEDVKSYLFAIITLFLLIGGLLLYQIKKSKITKDTFLLSSKIIFYIFVSIVALSLIVRFENMWTMFHYLFFPQGNWLFSQESVLITLYGGKYFMKLVFSILIAFLMNGVILYILEKRNN